MELSERGGGCFQMIDFCDKKHAILRADPETYSQFIVTGLTSMFYTTINPRVTPYKQLGCIPRYYLNVDRLYRYC